MLRRSQWGGDADLWFRLWRRRSKPIPPSRIVDAEGRRDTPESGIRPRRGGSCQDPPVAAGVVSSTVGVSVGAGLLVVASGLGSAVGPSWIGSISPSSVSHS